MTTSIPVDETTKARLERRKRGDETWSEFLDRLVATVGSMEPGVWADTDKPEMARRARRRARDGFD